MSKYHDRFVTMSRFYGTPEPEDFASHLGWGLPEPVEPVHEPGVPRAAPHAWRLGWLVASAADTRLEHPYRFLECPRVAACVGRAIKRCWDDFTCGDCRYRNRDYPLPKPEEFDADDD